MATRVRDRHGVAPTQGRALPSVILITRSNPGAQQGIRVSEVGGLPFQASLGLCAVKQVISKPINDEQQGRCLRFRSVRFLQALMDGIQKDIVCFVSFRGRKCC